MLYYNSVWILLRLFYAKQNAPIDFSRALKHAWIKHRSVLLFFFFVRKKFVSHVRIEEKQEKKNDFERYVEVKISFFHRPFCFFVTPPKKTPKKSTKHPPNQAPPKDQKINTPHPSPQTPSPPTKDQKNQQKRQKKHQAPPKHPLKTLTNKQKSVIKQM